jgi:hypothetical protein
MNLRETIEAQIKELYPNEFVELIDFTYSQGIAEAFFITSNEDDKYYKVYGSKYTDKWDFKILSAVKPVKETVWKAV